MKSLLFPLAALVAAGSAFAQRNADAVIRGYFDNLPMIAVPDVRGPAEVQNHMAKFNEVLFKDLEQSGYFRMASKSFYPSEIPQQPIDFKPPRGNPPERQGPWLTDWTAPSIEADWLTVGYAQVQNARMVLFGWLFNVRQPDLQNAQSFGKVYFADTTADGAAKLAHEFAADIIRKFGGTPLFGTRIYFTSNRTGAKEIFMMDYDGSNQKQLTREGNISNFAAVSPDSTRLAFTSFPRGNASILMQSLETGRKLPFYNQRASTNASPEFSHDGQKILFASTAAGIQQIYVANLDGSAIKRLTYSPAVETEPKVNPKTGSEIIFTSGRSGPPQIYKMNMDGAAVDRLTNGEGEAVNPAWHPEGQLIAFSWTAGPDPGIRNIFIMDVASKSIVQLTHGAGRNENPSFSPDGRHLVFQRTEPGARRSQIHVMLANGTQGRQLTSLGANEEPVWSKN
jgi:TolB protein